MEGFRTSLALGPLLGADKTTYEGKGRRNVLLQDRGTSSLRQGVFMRAVEYFITR